MPSSDPPSALEEAVTSARKTRLQTVLDPEDDPSPTDLTKAQQREALLGACGRNTVALARTLSQNFAQAEVQIRTGLLDLPDEPLPDEVSSVENANSPVEGSRHSLAEAKDRGLIHHWVEVTDTTRDRRYICDMARESPTGAPVPGDTLVTPTLPTGYVPTTFSYSIPDLEKGDCPFDTLLIWNAVREARDHCLADHGVGEDQSHFLRGYCHEHAAELVRRLAPAWDGTNLYGDPRGECYIQYGVVTHYDYVTADPDSVTTADDVADAGGDHYWVEAQLGSADEVDTVADHYSADIWSHTKHRGGEPVVTTGRPESYTPAEEARTPYRHVLRSEDWYKAHL